MIYLLDTRQRCVYAFERDADALAQADGVDVEAGLWRFFDAAGAPLLAHFTEPNDHGRSGVTSGVYGLVPAPPEAARLQDLLHEVRTAVVDGRLASVATLRKLLAGPVPP